MIELLSVVQEDMSHDLTLSKPSNGKNTAL